MESEVFYTGVAVGINLYQKTIIAAHKRKEPLKIDDELFYLQSGRERLQETLDKICR